MYHNDAYRPPTYPYTISLLLLLLFSSTFYKRLEVSLWYKTPRKPLPQRFLREFPIWFWFRVLPFSTFPAFAARRPNISNTLIHYLYRKHPRVLKTHIHTCTWAAGGRGGGYPARVSFDTVCAVLGAARSAGPVRLGSSPAWASDVLYYSQVARSVPASVLRRIRCLMSTHKKGKTLSKSDDSVVLRRIICGKVVQV